MSPGGARRDVDPHEWEVGSMGVEVSPGGARRDADLHEWEVGSLGVEVSPGGARRHLDSHERAASVLESGGGFSPRGARRDFDRHEVVFREKCLCAFYWGKEGWGVSWGTLWVA